jgi:hypothetical protein
LRLNGFGWECLSCRIPPGGMVFIRCWMKKDSTRIRVVEQMFDGSFVLVITTAVLFTEWYLAAEQVMTDRPTDNRYNNNR